MKEQKENEYVKRTQKDYSYAFKLSVVQEVESGALGNMGFNLIPQLPHGCENMVTLTGLTNHH